jgi:hypothetical protein
MLRINSIDQVIHNEKERIVFKLYDKTPKNWNTKFELINVHFIIWWKGDLNTKNVLIPTHL